MLNTKGDTDLIFKWIFGFIAGALFLAFFITLTYRHITGTEQVHTRELITYLDDNLDAFSISESSTKTIPLPSDDPLIFTCNTIASKDYTTSTEKLIFAPQRLTSTTLHAWTMTWRYPYAITNLFYLSDPDQRIVITSTPEYTDFVQDLTIPSLFNILIIPLSQLTSTSEPTTIISFGKLPNVNTLFTKFTTPNLIIVEILPNQNKATIHTRTTTRDTFYLGEPLLYGLIFGPEEYDCVKNRALERLRALTTIHKEKAEHLTRTTQDTACKDTLLQAITTLEAFKTLDDALTLHTTFEEITQINKNLEYHDCPTLY